MHRQSISHSMVTPQKGGGKPGRQRGGNEMEGYVTQVGDQKIRIPPPAINDGYILIFIVIEEMMITLDWIFTAFPSVFVYPVSGNTKRCPQGPV